MLWEVNGLARTTDTLTRRHSRYRFGLYACVHVCAVVVVVSFEIMQIIWTFQFVSLVVVLTRYPGRTQLGRS